MKSLYYSLITFVLFLAAPVSAQDMDHDSHHHHLPNEVGISMGAMYGINDKVWGPAVHVHYLRGLGSHSRWAIGGYVEQAWLEESHFAFGVGAKYELFDRFHLGLFPGMAHSKHEGHKEWSFVVHSEVVYDLFEVGRFHFGPVADYAWSKDDAHCMVGVHAAVTF